MHSAYSYIQNHILEAFEDGTNFLLNFHDLNHDLAMYVRQKKTRDKMHI